MKSLSTFAAAVVLVMFLVALIYMSIGAILVSCLAVFGLTEFTVGKAAAVGAAVWVLVSVFRALRK